MTSKTSQKKGFMHLMERKRPFYICVIALQGICRAIAQAKTNKSSEAFLEYFRDTSKVQVKAKDFARCNRYYLNLVKSKNKKIFLWLAEYKNKASEAYRLTKKYSKKKDLGYSDVDRVFSFFEEFFFVKTALPFFICSGINFHLENGGKIKDFDRRIISAYYKLRAKESAIDAATFRFVERAATIIGCDKKLAGYLTPDEIRSVFKSRYFDIGLLRKRKVFCRVVYKTNHRPCVEYHKSDVSETDFQGMKKSIRQLSGKCAYGGIARGKVRIVNTVEDAAGFRRGEVIVSVNANPRIAPFIKKAAALVTDEGGIMCHATIFAREFKKSCITGTKIATKVFKNGDMVEVDANKGLVRKISV